MPFPVIRTAWSADGNCVAVGSKLAVSVSYVQPYIKKLNDYEKEREADECQRREQAEAEMKKRIHKKHQKN
ncbi:MAG: hypothetical protein EZS28_043569 [Streblomastix strix]|uniref:Uncharacterized protein n=1 Tax=Streblomastix strix TaxID=222440 RepID=A0A5J4TSK2_9EUKA|nr:MAG: hypothetical protein EZS28_043569 [Streblomastix strix]